MTPNGKTFFSNYVKFITNIYFNIKRIQEKTEDYNK